MVQIRTLIALLVLTVLTVPLFAANHYILPSGSGAATGADWSNACNGFSGGASSACVPTSMVRGDTYYVGGGTYGVTTFHTSESGTSVITIKGATAADHGTATGWTNSLGVDVTPASFATQLNVWNGYYIIDGNTPGSPSTTAGGAGVTNGFTVALPSSCASGNTPIAVGPGGSTMANVQISHFYFIACSGDVQTEAVAVQSTTTLSNLTVSYSYFNGFQVSLFWSDGTGLVLDHNYMTNAFSSSTHHGNQIDVLDSAINPIISNNIITNCAGTTCLGPNDTGSTCSGGLSGGKIYGNVFNATPTPSNPQPVGDGIIAPTTRCFVTNTAVYNNVFTGSTSGWFEGCVSAAATCSSATGNIAENNIVYDETCAIGSGVSTNDYNSYLSCTDTPPTETHGQVASFNPFVNVSANNFLPTAVPVSSCASASATCGGLALSSPYTNDPNGVSRTVGGLWQRGAFSSAGAPGPQTLYLTPLLIANGSTSNTINVSCPTCLGWVVGTPGTPTFTVGYGTLVSQTVTSPTTATVVVTPSVTNNYTYITAPRVSGVASPALGVLTVQATFAAGQPFIVNGTTGNVVALTGIGASWTSTSPTFSISGCGTATKTAQAVLTDATATITLSAGSTDCTITITDSSTSNTTTLAVHTPAHWYVDKAIGGTRYSSNVTTGQCNGTADAAYPGSGTNQNCAFGDVRYMWQDGSSPSSMTFPAYGWLMQGGDTLTIVGSIAGGVSYRIGWPTAAGPGSSVPYFGISGDANDSGMPSPPSGIASQHTIIQGGNAGACTAQTARTQLHGGWGLDTVIYIGTPLKYTSTTASNSDFIDFQCVDVTDFAVGKTGGDYALSGAIISLAAHDLTFTDTRWHGLAQDCWLGTAGGTLTATDITWAGCGLSGWEADQGVNVTGFGAQNITNFQIEGNGCNEEYPIVDTFPYVGCSDDLSGGYGDGFGTASINSPPPGWQIHFDQGIADYNTQEGIDALHAAGANSSSSITRTLAYGNMGQQFKIGGGGTVANSQITNNCSAMKYPISGFPAPIAIVSWSITSNVASFVTATQSLTAGAYVALSGFGTSTFFNQVTNLTVSATGLSSTTFQVPFTHANGAATEAGAFTTWNGQLSSFCRAANTGIVIEIPPATTSYFEYNTIYAASGVTLEIEPYDVLFGGVWVGTEGFQYVDNVQVDNSGATPIYNQSNGSLAPLTNTGGAWKYNLTYQGASWTCPQSGESNGLCGTPGLSNQSYPIYGYNVMTPASGSSAVVGAGIPISGITIDYAGNARSLTTPTLGANEYLVPVHPPTSLGGAAVYGGDAVTH